MVRRYKPEDSEGVKDLILSILTQEYPFDKNAYGDSDIYDISGIYLGARNAFFVSTEGKKVIGTTGIKADSEKTALLRRVFVEPHFRRKGIGTELLDEAIKFCREQGYREIVFRATDRMKSAIGLISKHGFRQKETLDLAGFHIHMYELKL